MKVILASHSPRRKEILENVGVSFSVLVSGAEEKSESSVPSEIVRDIAACKGRAVYERLIEEKGLAEADETLILSADTMVVAGGEILGKPKNREDCVRMLRLLSGKRHEVMTGIALQYGGKAVSAVESTEVEFDALSEEDIAGYADTDEPYDKAGGYAIQGLCSKFVRGIHGCYFNVVGLPIHLVYQTAKKEFGIELY